MTSRLARILATVDWAYGLYVGLGTEYAQGTYWLALGVAMWLLADRWERRA